VAYSSVTCVEPSWTHPSVFGPLHPRDRLQRQYRRSCILSTASEPLYGRPDRMQSLWCHKSALCPFGDIGSDLPSAVSLQIQWQIRNTSSLKESTQSCCGRTMTEAVHQGSFSSVVETEQHNFSFFPRETQPEKWVWKRVRNVFPDEWHGGGLTVLSIFDLKHGCDDEYGREGCA